jgi:hypothetical protein
MELLLMMEIHHIVEWEALNQQGDLHHHHNRQGLYKEVLHGLITMVVAAAADIMVEVVVDMPNQTLWQEVVVDLDM